MNRLSIIACILFAMFSIRANAQNNNSLQDSTLAYHLSWDGKSTILKVTLDYTAANKDSTVFIYGEPKIGGQTEIFKVLQNVNVGNGDKIKFTPKERKVTVYHSRSGLKRITYEIDGHLVGNPKRSTVDELFRPLITEKLLYLVPHFFLLKAVDHHARKFSIQWDNYPLAVPYFISIAPESRPSDKQTILLSHRDDVLILMGSDIEIDKYKVHGIPYYSIISKSDTVNNLKAELDPFFTNYFPGLRDFWQDDDAPYYYITILPLLAIDKPWATGFSWGNGFIMKYKGKFDDNKRQVLAHETSHWWIGNGMQIGNDEFDNQWFGEGFNDYTMLINLAKSGILDKTAFVSYINKENFLAHYTSQVKSAPNDSIASNFWTNKNYQVLPYRRGFIYAFYLDNQIRLASNGKQSIRDFLLALFKHNKEIKATNPDAKLTLDDFINAASVFIPRGQVIKEVDQYMIKGVPLDFNEIKLIDGFKVEIKDGVPVLSIADYIDLKKFFYW